MRLLSERLKESNDSSRYVILSKVRVNLYFTHGLQNPAHSSKCSVPFSLPTFLSISLKNESQQREQKTETSTNTRIIANDKAHNIFVKTLKMKLTKEQLPTLNC